MSDDDVVLRLNRAEALVLSDVLYRWEQMDLIAALPSEHPAEMSVLHDVMCMFERELWEPMTSDCSDRLDAARTMVYDCEDDPQLLREHRENSKAWALALAEKRSARRADEEADQ